MDGGRGWRSSGLGWGLWLASSFMLACAAESPAQDTTTGLVLHYTFAEGTGTTTADLATRNGAQQGTLLNSPQWSTSMLGGALHLDGYDDRILFPALHLGTVHTAAVWVDFRDIGHAVVLGGLDRGGLLYLTQSAVHYVPDGWVHFGSPGASVPHGGLPAGQWVHLAVVRNGPGVTFYKNGQGLGSPQTLTTAQAMTNIQTVGSFARGQSGVSDSHRFQSSIRVADVRIYTRALTAGDIAAIHAAGLVADTTAPTAPQVTVTPYAWFQHNVAWTAGTDQVGVIGYTLLRCAGGGCQPVPLATFHWDVHQYADIGLTAGTAYTYQIRAHDAAGNASALSAPVTLATLPVGTVPTSFRSPAFYVAPTGKESHSCAQAQHPATPRQSAQGGIACLAAGQGQTLYLRQGTYTINANTIPAGSSWSTAATIAAYPGEQATIVPSGEHEGSTVLYFSETAYVILDGLRIHAASGHDGIKITDNAHHIRFIRGEIFHAMGQGVITGGAGGNEFLYCNIHDNGDDIPRMAAGFDHAFYIADGGHDIIAYCDVHHNRMGYAIHVFGSLTSSDHMQIHHNRIHHNLYGVVLQDGEHALFANNLVYENTFGVRSNNQNAILHNTIYNNDGFGGLDITGGTGGNRIENNIVVGNDHDTGIAIASGANTFRNNLVANNGSVNFSDGSGQTTSSGNLIGNEHDPAFVDAAAGNFQLLDTSAAKNAGRTLPDVTTDFVGTVRPQGGASDIGAYEVAEGGAPPPPPPPSPPGVTCRLTWGAVTQRLDGTAVVVEGYRLYGALTSGNYTQSVPVVTGTGTTVETGCQRGQFWVVRAVLGTEESGNSNEVQVPAAPPPPNLPPPPAALKAPTHLEVTIP